MKAKIDQDLCIGCGLCEGMCPKVFKMNSKTLAEVVVEIIDEEIQGNTRDVQRSCPVGAIIIEE